ncbi:Rrf2 family transcriptional regulator [Ignavibacterium sp.]|jgi:Rrf2 family protein|uniref:RrF2 family transcriptional regulator n=1 Tax=Ignavibacterium sp. TaxID=2651167 RepID=UPI0032970193
MLKLSKKTEYALMSARYMALNENGKYVTAREIANSYKLSYELVAKVLQILAKNKLIHSYQGVKGGYSLNKPAEHITLAEIIKAIEPAYEITECMRNGFEEDSCSYFNCCKIKDPLAEVQKKIDKIFIETKLSDLI